MGAENLTGFEPELEKCLEGHGVMGLPMMAGSRSATASRKYPNARRWDTSWGGLWVTADSSLPGGWLLGLAHVLRV